MKALALEKINSYNTALKIYTDGSKSTTGLVAASFYIPELNIQQNFRLSNNISVYSSEMVAIRCCMEWIISNEGNEVFYNGRNIAIFTDSLSSVLSLDLSKSESRPNLLSDIVNL